MRRPLFKLTTKIFSFSVLISGICVNDYISLQTVKIASFYTRGESVFYTVEFTVTVFSVSSFHGTSEASKTKNGGVAIEGPPKGSVN